jgi:hypothetical protein
VSDDWPSSICENCTATSQAPSDSSSGATFLPAKGLQHYAHACAGAAILACGVLITLGL